MIPVYRGVQIQIHTPEGFDFCEPVYLTPGPGPGLILIFVALDVVTVSPANAKSPFDWPTASSLFLVHSSLHGLAVADASQACYTLYPSCLVTLGGGGGLD